MAKPLSLASSKTLSKVTKLLTSSYSRGCKLNGARLAEHRGAQAAAPAPPSAVVGLGSFPFAMVATSLIKKKSPVLIC